MSIPDKTGSDEVLTMSRCNGTALRKAARRISQLYDAALAPCGIRAAQRSILAQIATDGAPKISELAATLVLDRSALNHNLKPLERDGLVLVAVNPGDRRSRLVTITRLGRAKLDQSRPYWEEAQRRFESAYGAENARVLRASLEEVSGIKISTKAD